ncbi:MAG: efflux RND transporter permease subunit [Betaproteobacteria bacterium]|nr:efflux RND transporter permease subunit [Betaproteobacteria bacterium]
MSLIKQFLSNHVLANLTFAIVILMGVGGYLTMPREQDPEINFNWINVTTGLRGASTEDIEKLVTQPLEDAIRQVSDIRYVSSRSQEGVSTILVRFQDLTRADFDKRINDLRREIQNKASQELPAEVNEPRIIEVTTSNGFPTAMVLVLGQDNDEILRNSARQIRDDLERLVGVDDVFAIGLHDPELVIEFNSRKLEAHQVSPTNVADSVFAWFQDVSAGGIAVGNQDWLVRLIGKSSDPKNLKSIPVKLEPNADYVPLSAVANVSTSREKPIQLAAQNGQHGVLLSITKKSYTNTIDLVDRISAYIDEKNSALITNGINLNLVDDQTVPTKEAINVMQINAGLGLLLVLATTWAFLGGRMAILLSLGIPFSIAGAFAIIYAIGWTLNVSILLGVVIALGMLVDDTVVVVEAIYYRISRGLDAVTASVEGLREVFAPVLTSVLTTIAAFLPLMLLPGIVGKFMLVVPAVVTLALAFSLFEAFWMLPAHIMGLKLSFKNKSRTQILRENKTRLIRHRYSKALLFVLRRPKTFLSLAGLSFAIALSAVGAGLVNIQFFAFDPIRIFYVNVDMPSGTPLSETMKWTKQIETRVRTHVSPQEERAITSVSGIKYTDTAPLYESRYGQVIVSLKPREGSLREVDAVIDEMRSDIGGVNGPANVTFTRISGGPPLTKPISVKVRGDNFEELRAVTRQLSNFLSTIDSVSDISSDDSPGRNELNLKLNYESINRIGIDPQTVNRSIRLFVDGEIVTFLQSEGEKIDVRVKSQLDELRGIDELLSHSITTPQGDQVALRELVHVEYGRSRESIRHYNFRRTITLEADIDREQINEVQVNNLIKNEWNRIKVDYPEVSLDFSGALDDIQESLDAMLLLFLFGISLIYLLIGTQFKSYFQPLMILVTVPLAFIGVVIGLIITQNPLSLYTMYGIVALTGISVNSAIVLIDAANTRRKNGMNSIYSIVYAARRRVVPILITSFTTIAGLLSLALGLGGNSLLWGPVASAIMWGLAVSTLMTLFVIPLLYKTFSR